MEITGVVIDLSSITEARGAKEVFTDSSIPGFGPLNCIVFRS